jgi:hypothetical protein
MLTTVFHLDNVIDEALDGEEALRLVQTENNRYSLIFMDCQMPIMDGYDATTTIRQYLYTHHQKQPIIVAVTAHAEHNYLNRAITSGMN